MKRLNVWIAALLAGILVFSGASLCRAQKDAMTNAQFADILVGVLGLEMPADAAALSDAGLFEVQANMLAESGIVLFIDARANALVTRGVVGDVLYGALIGPSNASAQDKVDYLAKLGYISAGRVNGVMSSADIIAALNVPALSSAIAEAYSPPGGAGVGFAGPGRGFIPPAVANPAPEGPASPI